MTSAQGPSSRIVWLTNLPAPYRRPVWSELGKTCDLRVWVTDKSGSPQTSNRESDWFDRSAHGYSIDVLDTWVYRSKTRDVQIAKSVARLLDGVDGVVLGAWESPAYWQLSVAAGQRGIRRVGFYESTLASQRYQIGPIAAARRRYFRALDAIVTPGPAATAAVAAMGVPEAKVYTGFNAVDVEHFQCTARAARARNTSALEFVGHRFIYMGQLLPRKNLFALLEAFKEGAGPDDTLTIAGRGPLREKLLDRARELFLNDRVRLVEPVRYNDVPALMARHHTLILPSLEEVWGLVVNEALAAGLQVLVTTACGAAPSVADMRGVILTDTDAASLARGISSAREDWVSWDESPEIMEMTPHRFAMTFAQALGLVPPRPQ